MFCDPWLLDLTYAVISHRSLAVATRYAHRQMRKAGVAQWQDYADCDDWALETWTTLKKMHAKRRSLGQGPAAQSPAVGIMGYVPSLTGTPHMVVVAVTDRGLVAWEPQPPAPHTITISGEEWRSFVRQVW